MIQNLEQNSCCCTF